MLSVSKILDHLRDEGKFDSDEKAADALGITAQTFSRWRRGKNRPDLVKIVNLAYEKEIPVDWLLFGKEPIHRNSEGKKILVLDELDEDLAWMIGIITRNPDVAELIHSSLKRMMIGELAIKEPSLEVGVAENKEP